MMAVVPLFIINQQTWQITTTEAPLVIQQIFLLNLRINDMMTQTNSAEGNYGRECYLKKANAALKAKQEKISQS
jgi:hypothetical protein